MKPKEFKKLKTKLKEVFQRILDNFYTDFIEVNVSEAKGQVFIINAFYGEEYIDEDKPIDRVNIVRPILHFQASDFWKNEMLDINSFFNINEEVFDEFYEMGQRGELDELLPILKNGLVHFTPKEIGYSSANNYFFLSVDSCIQGGDQFYRDLLNEGIAVIGYDETTDSIHIDTVLSERKKITALIDNKPVNLKLPFEKN